MSPDNLPTYIPLNQAATRYGVNAAMLRHAVESGIMQAVRTPEGGILVASKDMAVMTERGNLWNQVRHLDGKPIGIGEACRKYKLGTVSVYHWIEQGYVRVLNDQRGGGRGNKRTLNEADVAYASLVADTRGRRPGRRIFTQKFLPPHLSHLPITG